MQSASNLGPDPCTISRMGTYLYGSLWGFLLVWVGCIVQEPAPATTPVSPAPVPAEAASPNAAEPVPPDPAPPAAALPAAAPPAAAPVTSVPTPPVPPPSVAPVAQPLFAVVDRGRVGYMDRAGRIVVPLTRPGPGTFVGGLARMRKARKKWVFVDQQLRVVIAGPFDYARPFSGAAGAAVQVRGKWGIISPTGVWLVRPIYDRVSKHSEGAWTVKLGGRWGLIDDAGKVLITPRFDFLSPPEKGWAFAKQSGRWFWVDRTGKETLRVTGDVGWQFSEGLTPMRVVVSRRRGRKRYRWGYIDRTGKLVIKPKFVRAHSFSEGLAEVETDARMGFKFGYADKTGKVVIKPQWPSTGPFKNGRAMVKVGKKFGFIDRRGALVIPAIYDDVSDFRDGLARIELHSCASVDMSGGKCSRNRTDRVGWINTSGVYVWKPTLKR